MKAYKKFNEYAQHPLSKLTSSNQNVSSEQMKPTLQRGTNSPLQPNKFLQGCWIKSWQSQPSTTFNTTFQLSSFFWWMFGPPHRVPKIDQLDGHDPALSSKGTTRISRNVIKCCPLSTFFPSLKRHQTQIIHHHISLKFCDMWCVWVGGPSNKQSPLSTGLLKSKAHVRNP